jgi:hypothetical protein
MVTDVTDVMPVFSVFLKLMEFNRAYSFNYSTVNSLGKPP